MQSPYDRLQSSSDAQSSFIEEDPKVGYAKPSKPIVPELCLESIWIESIGTRYDFVWSNANTNSVFNEMSMIFSFTIAEISQTLRSVDFCIVILLVKSLFAICYAKLVY